MTGTSFRQDRVDASTTIAPATERQDGLLKAIEALSGELEEDPLLSSALRHACELFDADIGSVGIVDAAQQVVHIRHARGLPESAITAVPFGVGLAGEIARLGQMVHLDSYRALPHPMFQVVADYAVLGAPLTVHGRILGYLGLGVSPPRRFDATDVELFKIYTRHAAIALKNAWRFEGASTQAVIEERRRLALDLHDSVQGKLSCIWRFAQLIEGAWKRSAQEGRNQTNQTVSLIQELLSDLRQMLQKLHPPDSPLSITNGRGETFSDGLSAALRRLATETRAQGIRVEFVERHYVSQPSEVEEHLFAIAQEALSNVIKHSHASEATVLLSRDDRWIDLKIIDDGQGFVHEPWREREAERSQSSGIGLSGMRERTAALNGEFHVHPRPGGGTIIQVSFPALGFDSL